MLRTLRIGSFSALCLFMVGLTGLSAFEENANEPELVWKVANNARVSPSKDKSGVAGADGKDLYHVTAEGKFSNCGDLEVDPDAVNKIMMTTYSIVDGNAVANSEQMFVGETIVVDLASDKWKVTTKKKITNQQNNTIADFNGLPAGTYGVTVDVFLRTNKVGEKKTPKVVSTPAGEKGVTITIPVTP